MYSCSKKPAAVAETSTKIIKIKAVFWWIIITYIIWSLICEFCVQLSQWTRLMWRTMSVVELLHRTSVALRRRRLEFTSRVGPARRPHRSCSMWLWALFSAHHYSLSSPSCLSATGASDSDSTFSVFLSVLSALLDQPLDWFDQINPVCHLSSV